MVPGMDTGTPVAQAEQEIGLCCAQLLDSFWPELARHPLSVRIWGLSPGSERTEDGQSYPVHVPVHALTGSQFEILAALLHAMVHWVNGVRGIKDCCHRGYHNGRFRDLAQEVGFEVGERVHRFGWVDLQPSAELEAKLEQISFDPTILAPFLAGLCADQRSPRPCRANLPLRRPVHPILGAERHTLPDVPRLRVELVRVASRPLHTYPRVRVHGDAAALLWLILQSYDREALAVLFLDATRRVIGWDVPYIGTLLLGRWSVNSCRIKA